jgi:hypothetical protein
MPVKIGALIFLLWSILHIWVGFEGLTGFFSGDPKFALAGLVGGVNVPKESFEFPSDPNLIKAISHLILNFTIDVGGYGVLGLFVAYQLWTRSSWKAYFLGFVIIGIADMAFLFSMVVPGVIALNFATVIGPILWFVAVVITPFGMNYKNK